MTGSDLLPIPADRICIALDVPDAEQAAATARLLAPYAGWFKVGVTLFAGSGLRAVEAVASAGGRVFLDLKLHDIPAQVKGAVSAASDLGVGLLTVHAAGGPSMLAAAAEGRRNGLAVVAVTAEAVRLPTVAAPAMVSDAASNRMLSKCERLMPRAWSRMRMVLPTAAVLFGVSKTRAGASAKEPAATLA